MRPLEGIRVVEVAQFTFVPSAWAVMADWGADVIKVEQATAGDGQRGLRQLGPVKLEGPGNPAFEHPNRGKRSVGVDIGTPEGLEIVLRLVEGADVFLTNFLPAARSRLGIEVDAVRARNPDIVYARGSAFGDEGAERESGGYDMTGYWCRGSSGASITPSGTVGVIPQPPAYGDTIGGMTIAGGIATALFQRERTGEARVVDISLLGTAMWNISADITMAKALAALGVAKGTPKMNRKLVPNPIVNAYKTGDGRWLMLVMLQSDRNWPDLCRHLEREDLIDDPRFRDAKARAENKAECVDTLDAIFAQHDLETWKQKLATTEGVWAPIQYPGELYDDPQAQINGYLPEVELNNGDNCQLVAAPVQFDEVQPELGAAPEHGQHTEEVLLDLGLEWDDILKAKEAGAIL